MKKKFQIFPQKHSVKQSKFCTLQNAKFLINYILEDIEPFINLPPPPFYILKIRKFLRNLILDTSKKDKISHLKLDGFYYTRF